MAISVPTASAAAVLIAALCGTRHLGLAWVCMACEASHDIQRASSGLQRPLERQSLRLLEPAMCTALHLHADSTDAAHVAVAAGLIQHPTMPCRWKDNGCRPATLNPENANQSPAAFCNAPWFH